MHVAVVVVKDFGKMNAAVGVDIDGDNQVRFCWVMWEEISGVVGDIVD